jgi:hypothetical protein
MTFTALVQMRHSIPLALKLYSELFVSLSYFCMDSHSASAATKTTIKSDMRVSQNPGSADDEQSVFAVYCEDDSLDFEAGVHVMTPTSATTNAYVRKAKNVNISGGIYAAGNPQDIIRLLNELPQWAREQALHAQSTSSVKRGGFRVFLNLWPVLVTIETTGSSSYTFTNEASAPPESTVPRVFSNASGRVFTGRSRT